MNLTVAQKIQSVLQNFNKSQLVGIDFDSTNLGVRLEFTFGPEGGEKILRSLLYPLKEKNGNILPK